MDVLTSKRITLQRMRRRKEVYPKNLPMLFRDLDPADPIKRAKMKPKKDPFLKGKIVKANNKDFYNDPRAKLRPVDILDDKGNSANSVFLIPTLVGSKEQDVDPSDQYSCSVCYGTGCSPIFSPSMHLELDRIEATRNTYPVDPLICSACAGKGIPPIPLKELL